MALVKGKFVDKDQAIQSNNDPVDVKDLARKGYVDQKASDEADAAEQAAKDYTDLKIGNLEGNDTVAELVGDLATSVFGVLATKADLVDGKVPAEQLPSYVDDIIEFPDLASFPEEGEAGKIYVALDSNKVYRWSGSGYIEMVASPGSTDAVPEGATNLYFTDERAQAALAAQLSQKADLVHSHVASDITDFGSAASAAAPVQSVAGKTGAVTLDKGDVGLGNVDNTSDADKPISTATATALSGKQASLGTGTTSQYLRGDLTWQTISTSSPIGQMKYVAKTGNDSTGDGSQEKPYLTIAAAMAAITDATPSKRYVVRIAAGAYTEASVQIKANVFLVGESKESVRITGAVSMHPDFNQASSQDCRSGASMVTFVSAADFNWTTVTSPAGKLYFNEVVFASTLAMYGYNNAIAQAQLNACLVFGNMTVSGINLGVATGNIFYGNVTLNQHPNGGMATIFAATGSSISGTLRLNTTVNDFNRRCSAFLKGCFSENLIIDGAVSYVDCDLDSQGKSSTQKLNGGNLVALTPRINHDLETQMLKPLANNSHNLGDWGKQWFFNFAYVHASAGTDMYILSAMENYNPAGDSAGKSIYITPDGYGLQANVNGGNVEIETAAVSGTGVRGKVKINAKELDMTSAKITNLAAGSASTDAVNKGQLDAAIGALPGGLSGKKESFTLSAGDIANAYIDCAHLAAADTMMVMSGGVVHVEGESYTLSVVGGKTRITFIGDLVDPSPSKLEAGDKVHIQYLK